MPGANAPSETTPCAGAPRPQPPVRAEHAAFSIFHEPWWLDIAADGNWGATEVRENGAVIGRLPYPIGRRFGMPVSTLPSLIRTLGPEIAPLPGKPATVLRRRLEIIHTLIDQLPHFALFEQLFDPRISDAVAFSYSGFVIGASYCFRIDPQQPTDEIWAGMHDRRRRVIRRATEQYGIGPVDDVAEFCRFHDCNVARDGNLHGAARMRSILGAIQARGAGTMLGARDARQELIAAVTLVWDRTTMYYLLGTRRPDIAENGALSMLLWQGIQEACARGLTFDLDGINSPGMLHFLAGFGGTLTQRLRVRRLNSTFRLINAAESLLIRNVSRPPVHKPD
jgi:hypothetical protein